MKARPGNGARQAAGRAFRRHTAELYRTIRLFTPR
jgi:hypothetical protein